MSEAPEKDQMSGEKENVDKEVAARQEAFAKAIDQLPVATYSECAKCHLKQLSFTQVRTRPADSQMTTPCECQFCGNRWKLS